MSASDKKKDTSTGGCSRRTFLGCSAALTLGAAGAVSGCSSVPAVEFPAGKTADIPPGSRTFLEKESVFVIHNDQGYAAISAICTHLGCVIEESEEHEGYDCGCHGSEFNTDGSVKEGPADDPLAWYAVRLDGDTVLVDGKTTVASGTYTKP